MTLFDRSHTSSYSNYSRVYVQAYRLRDKAM